MLLRLLVSALIALVVGCAPVPTTPAVTETPRGPIVPTRVIPTATFTHTPAPPSPTPDATFEPMAQPVLAASIGTIPVAERIVIGDTITAELTESQPVMLYAFTAEDDAIVSIRMSATSGDLDPFVMVLDTSGREVARNDDARPGVPDAAITALRLPTAGDYLIVASRYQQQFGVTLGDYRLALENAPSDEPASGTVAAPVQYDDLLTGTISSANAERVFVFEGSEGDLITVQLSSTSGNLDPSLVLTDSLGNPIARNDDDIAGNSTNALLERVQLPASGAYSIIATRYQGANGTSAGDFRIKLTLDEAGTPGAVPVRYAILDPVNSGSIRSDGRVFSDFLAGDQLVEDTGAEMEYQVLLTFVLPPTLDGGDVRDASLDLGTCVDRGGGFRALNVMTVYLDLYGQLNGRDNFTRPSTGARIIDRLTECAPIDVANEVRGAYDRAMTRVQFRLAFRNLRANLLPDAVSFSDPRLAITVR